MTVTGSGATATVVADKPGTYSCTFTATANRECPPAPMVVGPQTATAVRLTSETEATTIPLDRARTTLGIGERVTISVDPPRSATWSVTGGGTITPSPIGTSALLTASMSPSSPMVEAQFPNGNRCAITFTVIAPNGLTSTVGSDDGCGTMGPPNNSIGASTVFNQIVQPTTVSFYRASFRENIPGESFTWPDGTADTDPARIKYWEVTQANEATDISESCVDPIGRLDPPPPGGGLAPFRYNIRVPEEYRDDAGAWNVWLPGENHPKEYDTAGRCRTLIEATNTAAGAWQGPWQ